MRTTIHADTLRTILMWFTNRAESVRMGLTAPADAANEEIILDARAELAARYLQRSVRGRTVVGMPAVAR